MEITLEQRVKQLEKRITALEGRVPARQTVEIPNPVINLTVPDVEKLQKLIREKIKEETNKTIQGMNVEFGKSSEEAK